MSATPLIIAHRGASHVAPENTLAAFRRAWREEADGIECDLRLTADGELVCMHDAGTGRVAGVERVVAETPLAELKRLDVGLTFSFRFMGQRIPTLFEVLEIVPPGKRLFMEMKCGCEILEPVAAALQTVEEVGAMALHVLAFDQDVARESKRVIPDAAVLWLTAYEPDAEGQPSPSLREILATLERTGADGVGSAAVPHIDRAFVAAIHDAGKTCHVWTVDDPVEAGRYVAMGVDSVTTNRPGWLREEMGRLG